MKVGTHMDMENEDRIRRAMELVNNTPVHELKRLSREGKTAAVIHRWNIADGVVMEIRAARPLTKDEWTRVAEVIKTQPSPATKEEPSPPAAESKAAAPSALPAAGDGKPPTRERIATPGALPAAGADKHEHKKR